MQRKFLFTSILIFLFLCCGTLYYFFVYDPLPPNVEIVVTVKEEPKQWQLSPNGDKIVYTAIDSQHAQVRLLFLDNQQKQEIENSEACGWISNIHLNCQSSKDYSTFMVNTADLSQAHIQIIGMDSPQLLTILQQAGKIYRDKKGEEDVGFFFVLSEDKNKPNENYQINSIDIDTTLKGYTYTQISFLSNFAEQPIKIYSPNQAYYFVWYGANVTIYNAKTNQQLAQYDRDPAERLEVGGWAWDSSGIYLKGMSLGLIMSHPNSDFPIRKLVIPK